ncbi:hypothetical protein D3790_09695 [Xenorhabdus nematophila]|nr:hypothetical protein D3790_09695 [Xenorhabdus nematophila]
MLPGINERLLPFTGGQPLAGQIRSRRICHSLVASLHLEIHWVYTSLRRCALKYKDSKYKFLNFIKSTTNLKSYKYTVTRCTKFLIMTLQKLAIFDEYLQ